MLNLIGRPIRLRILPAATLALIAAVSFYCLAYNGLSGGEETLVDAASWALVNVAPWFLAFEGAKRAEGARRKAMALLLGLAASLALQLLVHGWPAEPLFQFVRRLPWLLGVGLLLALVALPAKRNPAAPGELPLLPQQIDWVSAAANYVELHARGRTIVHRSSLASVEKLLRQDGFVRIHRSTLVRWDTVARIRPLDVLLHDGTSLKVGKRYRSTLGGASPESHPFVPAE